jgi:hypothetical protein
MNIMLDSTYKDIGFYDPIECTSTGCTGTSSGSTVLYSVTGLTESRLEELRTYSLSSGITKQYIIYSGSNTSGVVISGTTTGQTEYVIEDVTYLDIDGLTLFVFETSGLTQQDIVDQHIIKIDQKMGLYSKNRIESDVFIERQEVVPFDKFYKLSDVNNLFELTTYAGGNFFNIVDNT